MNDQQPKYSENNSNDLIDLSPDLCTNFLSLKKEFENSKVNNKREISSLAKIGEENHRNLKEEIARYQNKINEICLRKVEETTFVEKEMKKTKEELNDEINLKMVGMQSEIDQLNAKLNALEQGMAKKGEIKVKKGRRSQKFENKMNQKDQEFKQIKIDMQRKEEDLKSILVMCQQMEIKMRELTDLSYSIISLWTQQNSAEKAKEDLKLSQEENARMQGEMLKLNLELAEKEKIIQMKDKDLEVSHAKLAEYEQPATIIMDFFPIVMLQKRNAAEFFLTFYQWIVPIVGISVANDILAITGSRRPMKKCYVRKEKFNGQLYIYLKNLRSAIKFLCKTDGKILEIWVDGEPAPETIKPRTRFSHSYKVVPKEDDVGYENSLVCIPGPDFKWKIDE